MWLMLQNNSADDYVVATGETHSVREFVHTAFSYLGLDYRKFVTSDPKLFRPSEKVKLCGNPSRIKNTLHWSTTIAFEDIVKQMIDHEMTLHCRK
jgi:GDPmannose 4,6-dehydratase